MGRIRSLAGIREAACAGGLLLALALAACGGGESAGTEGAAAGASLSPQPAATAEDAAPLPLESFHYAATLTVRGRDTAPGDELVISTDGDFQAPGRHAFSYVMRRGDGDAISRSVVVIQQDAWLRSGDDPWRQVDRADPTLTDVLRHAFSALRPDFLGGAEFDQVRQVAARLPSDAQLVNGVAANHFQADSTSSEFFQALLSEDVLAGDSGNVRWELWLAADGEWPVRLLVSRDNVDGSPLLDDLDLPPPISWELRVDVSRPNDPTLRVAAPDS